MSHPFTRARSRNTEQEILAAKAFWKARGNAPYSFFCPQCRASRRLTAPPEPARPQNLIRIGLCAVMFMLGTWKWFEWKGIVSFIPFWSVYEIFYRSRMRATVPCPHCGFDPFLYLVDVQLARKQMEEHWRQKFAEHQIPYPEPKTPRVKPPSPTL